MRIALTNRHIRMINQLFSSSPAIPPKTQAKFLRIINSPASGIYNSSFRDAKQAKKEKFKARINKRKISAAGQKKKERTIARNKESGCNIK